MLQFPDTEINSSSLGSIFDRVAENIQQDLLQPRGVSLDIFMKKRFLINGKGLIFLNSLRKEDGFYLFDLFRKVQRFCVKGGLSAFYFAHIQNIVEKT